MNRDDATRHAAGRLRRRWWCLLVAIVAVSIVALPGVAVGQPGPTWAPVGEEITGDRFTTDAVATSSDGTTIAIGSLNEDTEVGDHSGRARVFRFDGAQWNQLGADINGQNAFDRAGSSVALSADGNTIVIGATQHLSLIHS